MTSALGFMKLSDGSNDTVGKTHAQTDARTHAGTHELCTVVLRKRSKQHVSDINNTTIYIHGLHPYGLYTEESYTISHTAF